MMPKYFFKEHRLAFLRGETVGAFRTVVCLDTFHTVFDGSQHIRQAYRRTVRVVLFKHFDIAATADSSIAVY